MRYLGLVFGLVLWAAALNLADPGETGTSRLNEKENKDKTKNELADVAGDEPSLLTDDDSEGKADQDNEKSDEMFIINGQQAAKQDMFVEDESPTTEVIDGVPGGDEPVEDPAPNGWTQHAFSWCTASGRTILKYGSEKAPITAAQCQALCVAKAGCKAIEHWNKFNYACFWCTDTSKITPYNNQNDLAYPAHVYVQNPAPTTPSLPDPCQSGNYKSLADASRLEGYTGQNPVKCDRNDITPGTWYRFQGGAGDRMPTTCVPKLRCGTHAPGWLNGSHPSVADGIVTRKVCYHWSSGCCQWSNNIRVKNCGAFFVYELQKPALGKACSLRYCGQASECKSYKALNQADRAVGYYKNPNSNVKCDGRAPDNIVAAAWYRMIGASGDQIPESCPRTWSCGTHAPGWLSGKHPTVVEGVVTRKVCYHWSSGCCTWHNNIKIRNCGSYYVYELVEPPVCSLRYCGNKAAPPTTPRPTTTPTTPAPDPCRSYKVLNSADRAVGNSAQNNVRCDQRDLATPGWYRFSGAAGDRMPTSCPPKNRCGTHAPGWLSGNHPSVAEGIVSRKVCYHWSSGCCQWSNNIKVKNCGAFFVYELQRTPVCSLRYCGDNGASPTTPRPTTTPTTPAINPCRDYKVLDGADRAVGNTGQNPLKCDQRDLATPGWYRFSGAAGDRMPTTCPPKNRCGTHAPGWLNGSYPTVADGVVSRKTCYHWSGSCCRWSNYIKVRNCGAFYVFELQRTPVCWLRYCGNNGALPTTPRPTTTPTTPTTAAPNPCRSYKVLSSADRAVGHVGQPPLRCDQRDLAEGWYRFSGAAGDRMPTSCVLKNRCGTHAPGWLNGSHPSVADGIVTRRVCYHWSHSCCHWKNDIRVKNCYGSFFVYYLKRTPVCYLRYCGNNGGVPTTRPPTPTRPTPPPHPAVNVTCGKNEMWISIPKSLMHGLDREHLRLNDVNCGARETRTHFILHTKLTECHTKSRHTKNFVCYMNNVLEIPVEPHQIITRVREVEIPFSCYYSNMGVVSAVGLQVKSKKIMFSKKGFGKFVLEMDIYPDHRYLGSYKKKDFPLMVQLRKILYVEVSVDTEDRRLAILAEECFATPQPDPSKPGLRYTFIKDGCAVDDTVNFIPTADKRTQRFSLEAFSFIGDHQFVFMHCKVKICNATDPNSRCAQGCLDRRKRSLITQESKDEEAYLAEGPFVRKDEEDETQLQETDKELRDFEKSAGRSTTATIALATVAVVCLVAVTYYIYDKKKRSGSRVYRPLAVPAE